MEYNTSMNINPVNWFLLTDLAKIEIIVVTLMKANIHKSRLKLAKPSVQVMLQSLKFEATKEYNIAKSYNKMSVFEGKWGELRRLLS